MAQLRMQYEFHQIQWELVMDEETMAPVVWYIKL